MNTIEEFLQAIKEPSHHDRFLSILHWIAEKFPELELKIAWNQPMFTHHETFIIGFSIAKAHMAIAPEVKGIQAFTTQIKGAGYAHGSNLFRIKWTDSINFDLLENMIQYNIDDKQHCTTFWRK